MAHNSVGKEKPEKNIISFLDKCPLFLFGLLFFGGIFLLYLSWGENTVFDVHDQLDETICSYVIPARHPLFTKTFSEMMCNLPADSMKASAPLFIPLYRFFDTEWAFLIQFFIETLAAFFGMYFLIKKITKSSLSALPVALLFAMLPFQPVYGLNIIGLPILLLCFYSLYHMPKINGFFALSILGIFFYTMTTHIALAGYVACIFALAAGIGVLIAKKGFHKEQLAFYLGILSLPVFYAIINFSLLKSLLFGGNGFVSHREDFVASSAGGNPLVNFWMIFSYGEENYAPSLHRYFLPVLLLLTIYVIYRYRKLRDDLKNAAITAFAAWGCILVICILHVILSSPFFADFQNSAGGFIRHTDFDRFYYFLPGCIWMLLGILGGIWIQDMISRTERNRIIGILAVILFFASLIPTAFLMKKRLNLYANVNYQNHGSAYTGSIGMAEYYHKDVLKQIDEYIGKEKNSYRIAHLGLSPAPSLVYGFYTVDGYSNNYPMEYKGEFRRVIAKELEEDPVNEIYFDTWGSRAYLFLAAEHITEEAYFDLPYDFDALKDLGCEYIFSDREIRTTDRLSFEKDFVSPAFGTKIYLYRIN